MDGQPGEPMRSSRIFCQGGGGSPGLTTRIQDPHMGYIQTHTHTGGGGGHGGGSSEHPEPKMDLPLLIETSMYIPWYN